MNDITEGIRRVATAIINSEVQTDDTTSERKRLEGQYDAENVYDTQQLTSAFEVQGFMAPFCVVKERKTGKRGSVTFQHSPRFYFNFVPA